VLSYSYFLLLFRALALAGRREPFSFMGLPQHQRLVLDKPQLSTSTSLPQGSHTNLCPFLYLDMIFPPY
jgi:hypothetical protein